MPMLLTPKENAIMPRMNAMWDAKAAQRMKALLFWSATTPSAAHLLLSIIGVQSLRHCDMNPTPVRARKQDAFLAYCSRNSMVDA